MTQPSGEFLELQAALAGEYSLQREIGRGGMGIVYLARDVQLDRDVAIKVLPMHLARLTTARERFVQEARTAAGLSHPHIVPIHRVGDADGFVFFVMSYVEGETLGERLRTQGPLPPAGAARVLREVAWALAYAHGRGIVHRDIKPDNILLEVGTGRAMVTDFGIAHGGAQATPSDIGKIMGTAHFMSPEQGAQKPLDGRSDIYSLGVVGYLAVSGKLPFEEDSVPALIVRQSMDTPPSLTRVAPGVPSALASAIDRCLDRDPAGRFPDGETLAAALAPSDSRSALPPALRAWLVAQNPLTIPYLGWSAGFSVLTLGNFYANLIRNPGSSPGDVAILLTAASLPIFPIVGFHINQARKQFRAGYTLGDLRSALQVAQKERDESAALTRQSAQSIALRALQLGTIASAGWLAVTAGLLMLGVIHENRTPLVWIFGPIFSTLLLGAVSNALGVQFIPTKIRNWWQTGIRERLWNSRAGAWLARRLGAPEQSRAVGGGVFRPTEAALGIAAGELFAALPEPYRVELFELPAIVAALEARAAEARAEVDVVAALARPGSGDTAVLETRRNAASANLAASVSALERIRLDLLRLHAGARDLKPLTTLIEEAHLLSDEARRLAEAEQEVEDAIERRYS
ncbi:MAG TPA: serine/threonine-protein kinase [Vicinamibacterales bacterium]|nr:serine/threonine-protein kinase [Vicinamibacterales bacterium]